jgi:hypothetical protein
MPTLDEDIVRDLLHRATEDLHAPPRISAGVLSWQHRRRRTRALGITVTSVAAATAVATVTSLAGGGAAVRPGRPAGSAIRLTAAQQTLNQLSSAAAAGTAQPPAGRYLVMAELQGPDKRTTVIDSRTGDVWTYQSGRGIAAELPEARHDSPTEAELAAYPTNPAALRSKLIAQAKQQQAQGIKAMLAQLAKSHDPKARQKARIVRSSQPTLTNDDWAFSQAAYLLWNPLVPAPLRAALFKVLASTPGVVVNSHARDSLGRAAVEISRYDRAANYTDAIFESPDASRVLETTSIHPATPAHDGLPAEASYQLSDTYLSITWTNTRPTRSPYGG